MIGKAWAVKKTREEGRRVMPLRARLGECAIAFLLSAALAGAEVLDGHALFALALVAVWGPGMEGFAALMGATLGYLSFLGFVGGLRYIAASMMVYAVALAAGEFRLYRKGWFMPVMAAALNGVVGYVYQSASGWSQGEQVAFATEILLTAGAVYCYRQAMALRDMGRSTPLTSKQMVGVLVLGATVMMTLARVTLADTYSLGRALCVAAVMTAGWKGGVGVGAAAGVAAGIAMDFAQETLPYATLAYALPGLVSGACSGRNRLVSALAYVASGGAAMLWTWNSPISQAMVYEMVAGAILFLLLPEGVYRRLSGGLRRESREDLGELGRELAVRQLRRTATAFRAVTGGLREAFAPAVPSAQDSARFFDRAAEEVCRSCRQRERCWKQEYQTTRTALSDASVAMLRRGEGVREDFPIHFSARCPQFDAFLGAANRELKGMLARKRYDSRVRESRAAVCAQYGQLAQVLDQAAGELDRQPNVDLRRQKLVRQRMTALGLEGRCAVTQDQYGHLRIEVEGPGVEELAQGEELARLGSLMGCPLRREKGEPGQLILLQREPLVAVAGIAAADRRGQPVSGDSGAWFKDEGGRINLLLCDGMGSGTAARQDSDCALGLLEKFLRAGLEPEAALTTVGEALALRGEDQGGFTTVDLLRVDLFSGRSTMYKLGAAPSYLRRGGQVERLAGKSLPAGVTHLTGAQPDVFPLTLKAGDWVIMASDGITAGREDSWVQQLFAQFQGTSPQELAALILQGSEGREGQEDDRTVMVMKIEVRK